MVSPEPDQTPPADRRALLRCEQLVVGHRGAALLPPIELDIAPGRVLLVVGRNGAGKSTWLQTAVGILRPISGRVVRGRKSSGEQARVVYVPQASAFDDIVPVRGIDVVGWARLRGWSFLDPRTRIPLVGGHRRRRERQALTDAVGDAGATSFAGQPFRELSGGQKQRVLFARVLASGADVALLDEPTAAMDMAAERAAYQQLVSLAHDHAMAVVIVTHTLAAAVDLADEVLFLDRGESADSGVAVHGPPDEVLAHPAFVRHFGVGGRGHG